MRIRRGLPSFSKGTTPFGKGRVARTNEAANRGGLGTLSRFRRSDGMEGRAEVCLKQAAACEQAARRASDDDLRAMYLDLARQWRAMAEQAEEIESRHARQARL
jgi:hypothetical protein